MYKNINIKDPGTMNREEFDNLPDPKFKAGQYLTDGEDQSFEVSFVEYDFDKKGTLPISGYPITKNVEIYTRK